ncbi:G protein-coupled receptor [Trichostrongylus colubriformis]|uniref:G protein-coupled receptor n=1 Tax=Trichostrongylus colubriformis TaxID=6319 RepID=A0AAN8J2I5_TRICO
MVPMLTISHIGITASTYLITFAAIERYCITVNSDKVAFLQKNRKIIAFIAVMAGLISKGTMLKEVTIRTNPQCIGMFNEWEVQLSDLVNDNILFKKIWLFYFRNIFTILAPFFILLYLNAGLIYRLQAHSSLSKANALVEDKQSFKLKKARIRAATRTLIIIVCTYLMSNLLSVIITIWEYLDRDSLFQRYLPFYVLSVAILSLLTVIASCLRLPIYVTCQPLLRKEMYHFLSQLWTHKLISRRMTLIENYQMTGESIVNVEAETPSFGKIEFV